jgi:hypothetical protein
MKTKSMMWAAAPLLLIVTATAATAQTSTPAPGGLDPYDAIAESMLWSFAGLPYLGQTMLRTLTKLGRSLSTPSAVQLVICCLLALPGSAWAVLPTPTASCGTLSTPGGVYQVTADITATGYGDCIKISAPFVSLDLNGFNITGTGSGIGIHVLAKSSDALIITNATSSGTPTVSGFQTGIEFDQLADRGFISPGIIIANDATGLELAGANNVDGAAIVAGGSAFGLHASHSNGDSFFASVFGPNGPSVAAIGAEFDWSSADFIASVWQGSEVGLHLVSSNNVVNSTGVPVLNGATGVALWLENSTNTVFAQYGTNSGTGEGIDIKLSGTSAQNLFVEGGGAPATNSEILVNAGSGQNRILNSTYDQAVDLNYGCDQNVWFDNTFTTVNQPCIQ